MVAEVEKLHAMWKADPELAPVRDRADDYRFFFNGWALTESDFEGRIKMLHAFARASFNELEDFHREVLAVNDTLLSISS